MSGKVFHTKAHARQKNEKYYTPGWVTEFLMEHIDVAGEGWTWEPAAGDNGIVRVLQTHGARIVASDIEPEAPGIITANFLTLSHLNPIHQRVMVNKIITNPPFGTQGRLAYQFCWHALRLMEPVKGKVAMLLRDDFDSAGGRTALFRDHPAFDKEVVLLDRIRWVNLPQKEAGPSGNHSWFIWDWQKEPHRPPTKHYSGRRS